MTTVAAGATGTVAEAELIRCIPRLRLYARYLARNHDLADDLLQDSLVRAMASAHQFQAGTNLMAWLCTILRNAYLSWLRRNRRRNQSIEDTPEHQFAVPATQDVSLRIGDFRRAFHQLNHEQRRVLILVRGIGLSYDEAADICQCPTGTIRSRLWRARQDLMAIMAGESAGGAAHGRPAAMSG